MNLRPGETLVSFGLSLVLEPATFSINGMALEGDGKVWVTNFRTIIRLPSNDILDIPHQSVIHFEKQESKKTGATKTFSYHCRNLSVLEVSVPAKHGIAKIINKSIYHHQTIVEKSLRVSESVKTFPVEDEFNRWNLSNTHWRITNVNEGFSISEFYPGSLIVPKEAPDLVLQAMSQWRDTGRIPTLVWGSENGASLLRCSRIVQDIYVDFDDKDSTFMKNVIASSPKQSLFVFDTAHVLPEWYPTFYQGEKCQIHCLGLPDEEKYFSAFSLLKTRCSSPLSELSSQWMLSTSWLDGLSLVLHGALTIAFTLQDNYPVLLQSKEGSNFVSIVSALAQVMIDPFYRTIRGLCCLIEKEFVSFGFVFLDLEQEQQGKERGHSVSFVLFLNALWQILQQFPLSFEFTEDILLHIIDGIYSSEFATFYGNSTVQRQGVRYKSCFWTLLLERQELINPFYVERKELISVSPSQLQMRLWGSFFLRFVSISNVLTATNYLRDMPKLEGTKDLLELSSLSLPSIPPAFSYDLAESITHMNLSHNYLTSLPSFLLGCVNLTSLDVSHNLFSFLSFEFLSQLSSKLKLLTLLDVSYNQLTSLPRPLSLFPSLRALHLDNNRLTTLPYEMKELIHLERLSIDNNQLDEVPDCVYMLASLETLHLAGNPALTSFLDKNGALENLHTLDVSRTGFKHFPPVWKSLGALRSLNLTGLPLDGIPLITFEVTQLTSLHLANLKITILPPAIVQLTQLTYLDLSHNRILTLHDSLLELKSLKHLLLQNNRLQEVPLEIFRVSALETLELQNNQLSTLSKGIGNLLQLKKLDISNNHIQIIHHCIGHLTGLEECDGHFLFAKNPLISPPPEIISKGKKELFHYLRTISETYTEYREVIVSVVGELSCGKTMLIRALNDLPLEDPPLHSTLGIVFGEEVTLEVKSKDKKIAGKSLSFSFLDFAGHPSFDVPNSYFLFKKNLFLVVWDSSQSLKRLDYWIKLISLKAPKAKILLVCTHFEKIPAPNSELMEKIGSSYSKNGAQIVGVNVVSFADKLSIAALHTTFHSILIDLPFINEEIPKSYVELRILLVEAMKQKRAKIIFWEELESMGHICNIFKRPALIDALYWLTSVGICVCTSDITEHWNGMIADPLWLNELICSIVYDKDNLFADGILVHAYLPQVWVEPYFYQEDFPLLLEILETMGVLYYVPETKSKDVGGIFFGQSLVPSLFSSLEPSLSWSTLPDGITSQFGRDYHLLFVPPLFVSQLFARLLSGHKAEQKWIDGLLLSSGDSFEVLVTIDRICASDEILHVTIRTLQEEVAANFFQLVDAFVGAWYLSSNITIMVPCIHCIMEGRTKVASFPIDDCLHEESIFCGDNEVELSHLIPCYEKYKGESKKIISDEEKALLQEAVDKQRELEMVDDSQLLEQKHSSGVTSLVYVPPSGKMEALVWSGSADGTICIWKGDGKLSKLSFSVVSNVGTKIISMLYIADTVWVLYEDLLRLYSAKTAQLKKEIKKVNLSCFGIVGKQIWGGTLNSFIPFDKTGKQKKAVRLSCEGVVSSLTFNSYSGHVWLGLFNGNIVIVNEKGKTVFQVETSFNQAIQSIVVKEGAIWSCSGPSILISNHSGQTINVLKRKNETEGIIQTMADSGDSVWSCWSTGKMILWNNQFKFYKEFYPHTAAVTSCIAFGDQQMWTSSADKSMRQWKQIP